MRCPRVRSKRFELRLTDVGLFLVLHNPFTKNIQSIKTYDDCYAVNIDYTYGYFNEPNHLHQQWQWVFTGVHCNDAKLAF